jgi:heptosyltransferase III
MDLRILVSRADRIGDLVLTLPAINWLKKCTNAHVTLHCSSYAKDIGEWARHNSVVDELIFKDSDGCWKNSAGLGPAGEDERYDYLLSFFHCPSVKQLMSVVRVGRSFGPRTKVSSMWTYNRTIAQHRSRVMMSEMSYNLELARVALQQWGFATSEFQGLSKLKIPERWLKGYEPPLGLVVSLSNGGSAQNWQVSDYLNWVTSYAPGQSVDFLVAGLDADIRKKELLGWEFFDPQKHQIVEALPSVGHLVGYLSQARRLVASSTGPLHVAHAAGVDVLGIYPTKRVESFRRWRPDGYWHDAELRWIEIS